MGSNANDVSYFIALFVDISTDGKFLLIVNILNRSFIILINSSISHLKPFNGFPSVLVCRSKSLINPTRSCGICPAHAPISLLALSSSFSALKPLWTVQVSQPDIAQSLLSAWNLLFHILLLVNPWSFLFFFFLILFFNIISLQDPSSNP